MKDRIFQLMQSQKMSQKEFSAELCISEGTLSSIYNGRTRPSSSVIASIHECFPNVSVNWLMFGEGEMFLTPSDVSVVDVESKPISGGEQLNLFHPAMSGCVSPSVNEMEVKNIDKEPRKITEIKVFFDDGTFQTFIP